MAVHARLFVVLFLISLTLVAAADNKKDSKKPKPKCATACTTDYTPICASDGSNKPITFGNKCVMDKAGCEQNKHYTKQYDGECKNGGGVRLS
ncbi:PI-actitoxin-Avd5a-like [Lycorma delicatula]|uniref:PI-actitoxin-Avd5a-like n=1 Tax=Lycorma delicatula TaxID=130591 RepID=UPI003F512851